MRSLVDARRRLRPRRATASFDLGREGGHCARRVVHAEDITGREIERALLAAVAAAPAHRGPAPTTSPSTSCRWPSTAATRPASAPTCSTRRAGEVDHRGRARHGAGHRRRRQGLPLHDQPRRRDRRRRGDGLPRRRARSRTWSSSSSTRPASSTRRPRRFLITRGAARRGRHPQAARRRDLHGALPRAQVARPARRGGARHRQRAQADRRRLRLPRHDPPRRRLRRASASRTSTSAAWRSASTSPASRSRWCRRPTTCAAAW